MKIFCTKDDCHKHKCLIDQTFVIVPKSKQYAFAFLHTAHCPLCKTHYTLITNFKFVKEGYSKLKPFDNKARAFGVFSPVHKLFKGSEADRVFDDVFEKQKAVIYEVLKNKPNQKAGFYLNYSEYGSIKRCYSNLSTLKLGRIKENFEDLNCSSGLILS